MNRSKFLWAVLVSISLLHSAFAMAQDAEVAAENLSQQIYTNKPYHGFGAPDALHQESALNTVAPYVSSIAKDPFVGGPKTSIGEINMTIVTDTKKSEPK